MQTDNVMYAKVSNLNLHYLDIVYMHGHTMYEHPNPTLSPT